MISLFWMPGTDVDDHCLLVSQIAIVMPLDKQSEADRAKLKFQTARIQIIELLLKRMKPG